MAIQTLSTIKKWFKTGLKPSQDQFWDTWDSYRHKYEKVPIKDIEDLENTLDTKAEKSQLDDHKNNHGAHAELFLAKEDKFQKGLAGGYAPLDEFSKITHQYLNVINNLTAGGETSLLSAEQGVVLQNQIDTINTLLQSYNVDLHTIQKIVDAVEQIQMSLNSILVNDLTTGGIAKALTAEMGKLLQTSKEDKSQKGIGGGYAPLDDFAKISSQYLTIINDLTTGGAASILSAEQGVVLQNQINGINTLLKSDNVDLDTIQEIVDAIEEVQISLDTILVNDLTTGGVTKALTAEMGKQLNEIKLTATIATDEEVQILEPVPEDNKAVTRSKLLNWWIWLQDQTQTITGIWNFTKGLIVEASDYAFILKTQMLSGGFIAYRTRMNNTSEKYKCVYSSTGITYTSPDDLTTSVVYQTPNQRNTLWFPDKTGTIAITRDFVTTARGTDLQPPLVIPSGQLTTVPKNGAIERDGNGQLWDTNNGIRNLIGSNPASEINSGSVQLATDLETQIDTVISEDNKVVSRSKLFNWWENIKTKAQTINATWNFSKGLKVNDTVSGNTTEMLQNMFVAQWDRQDNGINKTEYGCETVKWTTRDGWSTQLKPITPNQNRTLTLPNKSGTIAIVNDSVKTAPGTTTTPALIVPNGVLTTVPQNGAIERDENGQLWETHNTVRSRLITSSDNLILTAYKSLTNIHVNLYESVTSTDQKLSTNIGIGKIENRSVQRLNATTNIFISAFRNGIKPVSAKVEVFLKINNGLFATFHTGINAVNQVKIMEYSGLDNAGYKNYQNLLLFAIQMEDPLKAQWSSVDFPIQTIINGVTTMTDIKYYLRDAQNTRAFGASEASFCFVFVSSLVFDDPMNSTDQNTQTQLLPSNYALFLETIR